MSYNNDLDIVTSPPLPFVTCDKIIHEEECGCKYVVHINTKYGYKRRNKIHYCEVCDKRNEIILDKPLKNIHKYI